MSDMVHWRLPHISLTGWPTSRWIEFHSPRPRRENQEYSIQSLSP